MTAPFCCRAPYAKSVGETYERYIHEFVDWAHSGPGLGIEGPAPLVDNHSFVIHLSRHFPDIHMDSVLKSGYLRTGPGHFKEVSVVQMFEAGYASEDNNKLGFTFYCAKHAMMFWLRIYYHEDHVRRVGQRERDGYDETPAAKASGSRPHEYIPPPVTDYRIGEAQTTHPLHVGPSNYSFEPRDYDVSPLSDEAPLLGHGARDKGKAPQQDNSIRDKQDPQGSGIQRGMQINVSGRASRVENASQDRLSTAETEAPTRSTPGTGSDPSLFHLPGPSTRSISSLRARFRARLERRLRHRGG